MRTSETKLCNKLIWFNFDWQLLLNITRNGNIFFISFKHKSHLFYDILGMLEFGMIYNWLNCVFDETSLNNKCKICLFCI